MFICIIIVHLPASAQSQPTSAGSFGASLVLTVEAWLTAPRGADLIRHLLPAKLPTHTISLSFSDCAIRLSPSGGK